MPKNPEFLRASVSWELLTNPFVRALAMSLICDVAEQTSSTPCVFQRSFGCRVGDDGVRQLWIRHGCRGTFDCDGKRVLCTRPRALPRADEVHHCSCERSFLDTLPGGVCVRGGHTLSSSVAFWHFIHGHLLPTFELISTQGHYRPDLQVQPKGRRVRSTSATVVAAGWS